MASGGYFNYSNDPRRGEYFSPLSPEGTGGRQYSLYSEYGFVPGSGGGHRMSESHELLVSPREEGLDPRGLQTSYSFLPSSERRLLGKEFRRGHQLRRLAARIFFRLFVTLLSCGCFALLLKIYQDKGALTQTQKRVFNTLNVALCLVLSMNVVSAFKSMASMVKWRILAADTHRLREVDLILSLDSFQNVFELMRISTGRPMFCIVAAFWVLLGIGAQAGVALLGLSQGMETDGVERFTNGAVNVTDMTYVYPSMDNRKIEPSLTSQVFQAHLYGDMSTYFRASSPGEPDFSDAIMLEYGPGENDTYWKYHFRESHYVAHPGANGMPLVKTNRSITVTPSCVHFPIIKGQYALPNDTAIVVDYGGGRKVTIDWIQEWGTGATTYVNPGWDEVVAGNDSRSCGPRCNRIFVFQFADISNPKPSLGSFFNCTVNISKVEGGSPSQPFHQVPDQTATIAAGAIGMDGFVDTMFRQFVRYTDAVIWGARTNGSVMRTERIVGRFAAGVIAAYDLYGPSVEINGLQSHPGIMLKVNWGYVSLTLGCVLAVQLLVGVIAIFYANTVYCKDDSHLTNARLLRPFVERLGPSGSSAGSIELAMTFTRAVRYGVRSDLDSSEKPIHHIDLGDDIQARSKFPDGFYD